MEGSTMKRAKFLLPTLLMLLLGSVCNKSPTGPDVTNVEPQWAMYGGNVRHTGNVNTPAYDGIVGPTDSTTIQTKWSALTNDFLGPHGGGVEAPLVADANGTIYVTTSRGLLAITSAGNLKWVFEEGGNSSVALGEDGTVYYHGRTGYLHALAPNGALLWKTRTFIAPGIHPLFQTTWMNIVVLNENQVILTGVDSSSEAIMAINGRDGSLLWRASSDQSGLIKAVSEDGTIYVSQNDKQFFALSSSGMVKWSIPTESFIGGNFHVAIDGAGNIYKGPEIIAPDGTVIRQDMLGFFVALWYERYYTTTGLTDTLFCYSLKDEVVLWRDRHDVQFLSNPTVDQLGNVYVVGSGFTSPELIPGYLFVYNKEGKLIDRFIFDLPDGYALRKPFAPLLLPDGSVVIAGYEDVTISCVK